jgi:hypothetical protein
MKFLKTIYFLLSSLVFLCPSYGQESNDAGMWNTFTVQHSFSKKLNLVIDQEFRLKENYQRINLFYTNIGVDYKINKFIKISPTYRTIQKKQLEGPYSYRHRLMFDVSLKKKFKKITLSERIRYQAEVQDFNTSKKGKLAEQFLRFKTDLKYGVTDKITPYVSCELRYQIHAPRGDGPIYDNGFHRIRTVLGVEYEFNKKNSINIYYLYQTEYFISTPETIFILGIGYTLEI